MKSPLLIIKRITAVVWWILLIATISLLVCVLGAKFKGEVPKIFGYSVIKIVSGSMEPEIPSGAYILVKKTPPEEIEVGDIISFYSEDKTIYGMPNTHRVVKTSTEKYGEYTYITQGDANIVADSIPASSQKLIGKYVGKIGWLNSLEDALDGKLMFVVLTVLQIMIIAVIVCSAFHGKNNQEKTE